MLPRNSIINTHPNNNSTALWTLQTRTKRSVGGIKNMFASKTAVMCLNSDWGVLILTRVAAIHIANITRALAQHTLKQSNRWLHHQVESPGRGGMSVVAEQEVSDTLNQKGETPGELCPEAQQVLARLEGQREAARRRGGLPGCGRGST